MITIQNSIIIICMLLILGGIALNIGEKRTDKQNLIGGALLIIGSLGIQCII